MDNQSWSIEKIWNETFLVEKARKRPLIKRENVWASEFGKPYLDRYYAMNATPITNPFDNRLLRVFEVGYIFQWIVERVMRNAGLLVASESIDRKAASATIKVKNLLPVRVRYDFIGGGIPNYKQAIDQIKYDRLPRRLEDIALELVRRFKRKYPEGLRKIICEVKSVNSLAFWAHIKTLQVGYLWHRLQVYTQLRGFKMPEGKIIYISKDDLTIKEVPILKKGYLGRIWLNDLKQITHYIKKDIIPPKEEPLSFDKIENKWRLNWRLSRSPYFTKITGVKIKDKKKWENRFRGEARKKNKIIKGASKNGKRKKVR